MTNIGKPGDGQISFSMESFPAQDTVNNDRPGLDRRYGDLASLADNRQDFGEDTLGARPVSANGEADFLQCFRAAINGQSGDGRSKDGDIRQDNRDDAQIIAIAEQPNWMFLASPHDAISPVTETPANAIEAKVTMIAETIERTIRAELAPQPGHPLTVHIDFADETLNLAGLNVTVTPLNIDVVLLNAGASDPEDLAAAAQALAGRLMARFSKRAVRVLQSSSRSERASLCPLREIPSSLLSPEEG